MDTSNNNKIPQGVASLLLELTICDPFFLLEFPQGIQPKWEYCVINSTPKGSQKNGRFESKLANWLGSGVGWSGGSAKGGIILVSEVRNQNSTLFRSRIVFNYPILIDEEDCDEMREFDMHRPAANSPSP